MTPKSLLRHKLAVSTLDEMANGEFQHRDPRQTADAKKVTRVVVCGGKVYYDLLEDAQKRGWRTSRSSAWNSCIRSRARTVRRTGALLESARQVVWCQEEPMNQGAWYQIQHHLRTCLQGKQSLHYAGRARSPSPAAGHFNDHVAEQQA
jgi:2-oxoglutarate dehydrogenase E1 component